MILICICYGDYGNDMIEINENFDFKTFKRIIGKKVNINPAYICIEKGDKEINGISSSTISSHGICHGDTLNISEIPKENRREIEKEEDESMKLKNFNMQLALSKQSNPQSFATTTMILIRCRVNNEVDVRGLVDSGADSTCITERLAKRCKLDHLINTDINEYACGMESQKILGRIENFPIHISGKSFKICVKVLDKLPTEILFGLDFLKGFKCTLDMVRNTLVFGTLNMETPFLLESELKRTRNRTRQEAETSDESQIPYTIERQSETTRQMLFIDCKINNCHTKAFVDSASHETYISERFAKFCQIDHLIDTRFKSQATGIGSKTVVGQIHSLQLQIAGLSFTTPVRVLESVNKDIIVGLNFLKINQFHINLEKNILGNKNGETTFIKC